ncbi:hypothetical protein CA267_002805 [Alteromonas pelagimontana]|uniref:Uncharacterized protein n=1 Tax=Alteromonas pelagimontana TaxID=1858656 RepID=A0A6M4M9G3_9ALTE|nr:hypothetical protein [Alteromonas pelagimontana]QJR79792.1 hypothetical protein CA267_002805 [Alteromonas pelagimontana]
MFSRPKKQKQVLIDRQIRSIHQAIGDKMLREPRYFTAALHTLEHRYQAGTISYGSYLLWHGILEQQQDPSLFLSLLLASDSRTNALRRRTILTGILTEQERENALEKYIASELS